MSRTRSIFALVLPLLVLWAWIGCILVCVDETAGCEQAVETGLVSLGHHVSAEPLCAETCAPAHPAVFGERLNLTAPSPAAGAEATRVTGLAVAISPSREPASLRSHSPPPRNTSPLFIQFHNFRI